MLTGNDIVLNHPDLDWSSQTQHIFRDNLRAAAYKLITSCPGEPSRLMSFAEFDKEYDLLATQELKKLGMIFRNCKSSLTENPLFWVRVIGYSYACAKHLQSKSATKLGFSSRSLPIEKMVLATNDKHFISQLDLFNKSLENTVSEGF